MTKKFLSLTHYTYILLASPLKKKKIGSPKKKRRSRSSSTEMKNKRSLVGFIYTFSSFLVYSPINLHSIQISLLLALFAV